MSGALLSRKSAKYGVVAARQGLGAAKHHTLQRKASKTFHRGVDGSVFGRRRRERIALLAKFGEAGLGRKKAGPERSRIKHCLERSAKMDGRMRVWIARAAADRASCRKRSSMALASKAGPGRSKPVHFKENSFKNTPKWDGWKRVWTAQA